MSTERHSEAHHNNLEPRFPPFIDFLNFEIYLRGPLNAADYEKLCRDKVAGFKQVSELVTSDEYRWFCALEFAREGKFIVVAIPWNQDKDLRNGIPNDRSVAFYTDTSFPDADAKLNILARDLRNALSTYRKHVYR